jgi:topoisomerase-4 subunit A
LLLFADNGRVFTLGSDKLPGGRGFGEPVRLMIDLEGDVGTVALMVSRPAEKLLLAASDGKGFVAQVAEIVAETRKGRQVVNVRDASKLRIVHRIAATDDYVAVIGENRKLVVFPLAELPEMTRGQGASLQRYRDGGLSDAISFRFADGLSWTMGGESGRTRIEADLGPWRAARGAAGRMPPTGFPRNNRFGRAISEAD